MKDTTIVQLHPQIAVLSAPSGAPNYFDKQCASCAGPGVVDSRPSVWVVTSGGVGERSHAFTQDGQSPHEAPAPGCEAREPGLW